MIIQEISIAGSGNMAFYLARVFKRNNILVKKIISRNIDEVKRLAKICYAEYFSIDKVRDIEETLVLAVSDTAIEEVCEQLLQKIARKKFQSLLHTAGSTSIDVLEKFTDYPGVFYPFQTLKKDEEQVSSNIPIFIETRDAAYLEAVKKIANSISSNVYEMNSEDRKYLHLAAVFACNFSNHMYTLANEICNEISVDFSVMHHLIKKTIENAVELGPDKAQTGPAARGDSVVMNDHLNLLREMGKYDDIYKKISESIQGLIGKE